MRTAAAIAAAVALACGCGQHEVPGRASAPPPEARFVGGAACARCHAGEAAAWARSHHARALQPAGSDTILGSFAGVGAGGVTFHRSGDAYLAGVEGRDYEVTHTLGVEPLQELLVKLPGGRLQALPVAWDGRPSGQRWFPLEPGPSHWTGFAQNWNYMCADCHSTNVRKGFDAATASYATTFAEMSVSCEACHGPGSLHVESGGRAGLVNPLRDRAGASWARDASTGLPRRSAPRTTESEIETCARCHARRGIQHEDSVHGQPAGDDYRMALLDDDLYFPDGQVKAEVYELGSFLQSRMYAEGVTCSDCHDPHLAELRAPGDQVCLRCHAASYASTSHHFHRQGTASCVSCHMPAKTFMVVDVRHDHSLRVPRPDLSLKLGVPNACNDCHADRSAAWAERKLEGWYGHAPSGFQRFAETLDAGNRGAPGAGELLAALVEDESQPAIARASAVVRMPVSPRALLAASTTLHDRSPLVRRAAATFLQGADPAARASLLTPLLSDPVRSVRIEAAAGMAGSEDAPATMDRARAELVAADALNGDRPEAHLDLALLHAREGSYDEAEAELKLALAIDPEHAPSAVNLADLYRATGRDLEGEQVLRESLRRVPGEPAVQHALGLWLVRQGRKAEAMPLLKAAARRSAAPRYAYVYAVALHDAGKLVEARSTLLGLLRAHPFDRDALTALLAYRREAGDARGAQECEKRLQQLAP